MNYNTVQEQQRFTSDLEPFLQMLEEKGTILPKTEWKDLVCATKERIALAPEQYLSGPHKPSDELTRVIDLIFVKRLN